MKSDSNSPSMLSVLLPIKSWSLLLLCGRCLTAATKNVFLSRRTSSTSVEICLSSKSLFRCLFRRDLSDEWMTYCGLPSFFFPQRSWLNRTHSSGGIYDNVARNEKQYAFLSANPFMTNQPFYGTQLTPHHIRKIKMDLKRRITQQQMNTDNCKSTRRLHCYLLFY